MKTSIIMFMSKILIDLCLVRQRIRIKTIFVNVVYSFLVMNKF